MERSKKLGKRKMNSQTYENESYVREIIKTSNGYLAEVFSEQELRNFLNELNKELAFPKQKIPRHADLNYFLRKGKLNTEISPKEVIDVFTELYIKHTKRKYQKQENPNYNGKLHDFINKDSGKVKIIWGDCRNIMEQLPAESVHLMVTSPPYYNAREYSQWETLSKYLEDMKQIIQQAYRVLDNHRVFVFNVGDIFDNDNLTTTSVWGDRRLPLGAYFIKIFEECGFTFVDDFIWDKGEVQSERHKNGDVPYPFYQYPMNCYEHILIFHKHRLDKTRYPCSVCGSLKVSGNTQSEIGLQSWECKNDDCFERSESNRGKRFSLKTILTQDEDNRQDNKVTHDLVKKWRRDIIKFSPVIKINSKGENKLGHTAPFPDDIPEMAVQFYTYKGDVVLDPFAGSFTSAIVANKLGRIGVGCELRKDLFSKSIKDNINKKGMKLEEFELR